MIGLHTSEEELRKLLVEKLNVVPAAEFAKAADMARRFRVPLERALVERTGMPSVFLLKQLAEAWGVGFIDLKVTDVEREALDLVGEALARAHVVVPFRRSGQELQVATTDPRNHEALAELATASGLRVVPVLAPEISIRRAHLLYRREIRDILDRPAGSGWGDVLRVRPGVDDGATIKVLDRVLEYGAVVLASDIHIEPYELETVVRYRVDGLLRDVLSLPPTALPSVVARIKVLAHMRIDEHRVPQDGQFSVDLGGVSLDFRVSTLPTVWGEKIVLRIHSREIAFQDLEDLGLSAADHAKVLRGIRRPFGMVLMTGPTASGKSTSLYAALIKLGAERQNTVSISTVEDPVEFHLPRVTQVQINPTIHLEFGTTLRALLRQDPDIIMVGEIRDLETADLAVRAALVGRLFFSTLHTNDAPSAIPRLIDIGVEPFLLASTLVLVVSQRLIRRVCPTCRESVVPEPSVLEPLRARPDFERVVAGLRAEGVVGDGSDPFAGLRLFRGRGCPQCAGTGYRRRLGVFEVMEIDDEIRGMIRERKDAGLVREAAIRLGMKTMFQDGLAKAFLGETTLEEVFRVAS
jgi:type II secretory ATPase GspE/PulE/Tfp pilus assembly ATPase PilB-like protein